MILCLAREKKSLSPFCFGDEATTFWVSLTKFQLPNNFPHHPLFSRYLLPEKGRKNHPPHFIYRRLSRKNRKGNPLFADAHRGSQKRKRYFFLLVWSAKFGGYDIEYPLFWQKNQSKITENFCGNPRSSAERVPQGKITGKNSGKKKGKFRFFFCPKFLVP